MCGIQDVSLRSALDARGDPKTQATAEEPSWRESLGLSWECNTDSDGSE